MSGVEGAEREDYDECEAGVGEIKNPGTQSTLRRSAKDAKETNAGVARWFDTWLHACRIEMQVFLMRWLSDCRVEVQLPSWRNWQTRMVQVHVLARVWGFESLRWHQKS